MCVGVESPMHRLDEWDLKLLGGLYAAEGCHHLTVNVHNVDGVFPKGLDEKGFHGPWILGEWKIVGLETAGCREADDVVVGTGGV